MGKNKKVEEVEEKPVSERGWKQLGSRVHPDMHQHLRIEALKRRTSITVLVNEALIQKFGRPKRAKYADLSMAN